MLDPQVDWTFQNGARSHLGFRKLMLFLNCKFYILWGLKKLLRTWFTTYRWYRKTHVDRNPTWRQPPSWIKKTDAVLSCLTNFHKIWWNVATLTNNTSIISKSRTRSPEFNMASRSVAWWKEYSWREVNRNDVTREFERNHFNSPHFSSPSLTSPHYPSLRRIQWCRTYWAMSGLGLVCKKVKIGSRHDLICVRKMPILRASQFPCC